MKKIITLLVIIPLNIALHAGDLNYFSGTWNESLKKAGAEKKYVMLDCYTDWCGWCKVMDRSTFKSDTTITEIDKNFVAIKREMEKDPEGLMIAMKYHIQAFPTYLIFSPEGKLIYTIVGYRPTQQFVDELMKAENPATQVNYPGYSPALDPGFPEFYKKSYGTGKARVNPSPDTVNTFLDKQKDITAEVPWDVIARFNVNDKYSNLVLSNADKLRGLYGKDQVDNKIYAIIFMKGDSAANKNDEKLLNEALADLDKYFPGNIYNGSNKRRLSISFYEKNNGWVKVTQLEQAMLDTCKPASMNSASNEINDVCWGFYEKCDDKTALELTLPLMKKITDAVPEYASMDTYASLLYKAGHYKEAKTVAENAIALGKKSGDKTDSTEKLLVDINTKLKQ
ncbi:MAG: DUF255 domain-containing protein [Bacteroidetes bacterium]|nr:DUF255 domain-containing protein [Bacteroidota bacterium]